MTKFRWVATLLIVCLVVLGFVYRHPLFLRITGMKPFVQDRFVGWVKMGADERELDAVLGRINRFNGEGRGSWVYELSKTAAEHEQAAASAEGAGNAQRAASEYKAAAIFYSLARFPFASSAAKEAAYERHIDCYLKAARYFEPPLEIVRIPFEGKEIIAYLRTPKADRPPVVILSGGVDTWKSDLDIHVDPMLERGMAVLALDMPGTGESAWPLGPHAEKVYRRAIDYVQSRPDLDGNKIGVYMISFGGYFAVKLALTEPDVKAAVNVGGPLEISFTAGHVKKTPDLMAKAVAHAMRLEIEGSAEEKAAAVEPMALSSQGLLKKPERQAAILSINGAEDELVSIKDLYVLSKNGIRQEEWVYKRDGHCAPNHLLEYPPKAAAWLKAHLDAR